MYLKVSFYLLEAGAAVALLFIMFFTGALNAYPEYPCSE